MDGSEPRRRRPRLETAIEVRERDHHYAAGADHPRDFASCGGRVEPVERVCSERGVDGGVGKRNRLRRSFEPLRLRHEVRTDLAHRRERLDRDHVREPLDEQASELSGAGGEVEHRLAFDTVGDRCRPASPPTLVVLRDRVVDEPLWVAHGREL